MLIEHLLGAAPCALQASFHLILRRLLQMFTVYIYQNHDSERVRKQATAAQPGRDRAECQLHAAAPEPRLLPLPPAAWVAGPGRPVLGVESSFPGGLQQMGPRQGGDCTPQSPCSASFPTHRAPKGPMSSSPPPSQHPAQPGTETMLLGVREQRGGREGGSVGGPTNLVISLCTEPLWRSCHRGIKCRLLTPCTKSQGPGTPPPSPPPQPLLSRLRPSGSQQPSALCPSPPGFAHLACLEPSSFPPWLTSPPRLSQAPHAPGRPICPTGVRGSPALSASGCRALGPRGPFSGTGPKFRIYLCGGKTCILFPQLEIGHHLFRLVFSCSSSD